MSSGAMPTVHLSLNVKAASRAEPYPPAKSSLTQSGRVRGTEGSVGPGPTSLAPGPQPAMLNSQPQLAIPESLAHLLLSPRSPSSSACSQKIRAAKVAKNFMATRVLGPSNTLFEEGPSACSSGDENLLPGLSDDTVFTARSIFKDIERNEEELESLQKDLHRAMLSIATHVYEARSPMASPRTLSPRVRNIFSPVIGGQYCRSSSMNELKFELQNEVETLQSGLDAERQNNEILRAQVVRLEDNLREQRQERQVQEAIKADVELERDQLLQDLDTCRGELFAEREALTHHKKTHERVKGELMEQAKRFAQDIERSRSDASEKQATIVALTEEAKCLKGLVSSLEEEGAKLQATLRERDQLAARNQELLHQIEKHGEQLQNSHATVEKLKEEHGLLQAKCDSMKQMELETERCRADTQKERDEVYADLEECRAELVAQRIESADLKAIIVRMQAEIEHKVDVIVQNQKLQQELAVFKVDLSNERAATGSLREEKARMEGEVAHQGELSVQNKKLQEEIEHARDTVCSTMSALASLKAETSRLQAELSHKVEMVEQQQAHSLASERFRGDLERERDQLHQDIEEARAHLATEREKTAKLSATIQAEVEHRKATVTANELLKQEIETSRAQEQKERDNSGVHKEERVKLETENKQLLAQNHELTQDLQRFRTEASQERDSIATLREDKARMQSELVQKDDILQQNSRLEKELERCRLHIESKEAIVQEVKEARARMEGELDSKRDLDEQNRALEKVIEGMRKELEEQTLRAACTAKDCARLESELQAKCTLLTEAVKQQERLIEERRELQNTLDQAQQLHVDICKRLEQSEQVLKETHEGMAHMRKTAEERELRHENDLAQYIAMADEEAKAMEIMEADLQLSHDLLDETRQADFQVSYHTKFIEEGVEELGALLHGVARVVQQDKENRDTSISQEQKELAGKNRRLAQELQRKNVALHELEQELKVFRRQSAERLRTTRLFGESPESPQHLRTPQRTKLEKLEAQQLSEKIEKLEEEALNSSQESGH